MVYCNYIVRKYDLAIVIWMSMEIILKTCKTSEEILWKIGAPVTFNNEIKPLQKKDSFLSNAVNKQNRINMFGQLSCCKDAADLPIVQSAEHLITILVGDYADINVTTPTLYTIYSCAHQDSSNKIRILDIKSMNCNIWM